MSDSDRGQVAASAAEVYEEFFLPALFAQWPGQILDAVGVGSGDRVLDVGCGTGVLGRAAKSRHAQVTGIDPNEGMLALARRTADIDWVPGSAEELPFDDDSFDFVISQFSMMFHDDRARSVREMRRVLRPKGSLAVATWSSLGKTPGYRAMVDLLQELFGDERADALRYPFVLGDPDDLAELIGIAFREVRVRELAGVARFESIESWVHTDIRGWTLSDMSDADCQRLLGRAQTELARFADPDGRVEFPAPALLAIAS